MTHDDFLALLEGVKRTGSGHVARCPAHQDRQQSLGIHEGDEGKTLVRCYAGCTIDEVVAALGIELKDLFEEDTRTANEPEAIYDYLGENGELVQQVLRMPGKSFRQRRPDGAGGWVWKMDGVERVPYRLPEVLEAVGKRWIFIVEGEKDADAIAAAGGIATTNPGGAGKWQHVWGERYFKGAHVIVCVDTDDAGKKGSKIIVDSLTPHAAMVKVVRARAGKDPYDHLKAGHTLEEFVPFDLEEVTNGLVLLRAADIELIEREWIDGFVNLFPYGGISMLFGHPGTNKSTLTARLAAVVTLEGHDAIFLSNEGGVQEMKPRLYVAGADLDRCHFLSKREEGADAVVTLPHDVAALETLVEKTGSKLLIIDPLDAALGLDVDSYKSQHVRIALTPLHGVAQKHNMAIILVSHLNQEKSTDPMRRAGGPRFTGLARACALMALSRDDEDMRHLAGFKNNWGPLPQSKSFKLETAIVPGIEDLAVKLYEFGLTGLKAKHLLYEPREER